MSNQRNISLDYRRLEQIQTLADKEGLKIAQWIEARVAEAWAREYPNTPVPGIQVESQLVDGAFRVGLVFFPLDQLEVMKDDPEWPWSPFDVSPEVAQKLAFGLRGIALREITNFKSPVDYAGASLLVQIRRQGPGVVWRTNDVNVGAPSTSTGAPVWSSFSVTPAMALEIADCIDRVAKQAMMGIVSGGSHGADDARPANGEGASPPVDRGPDWGTW